MLLMNGEHGHVQGEKKGFLFCSDFKWNCCCFFLFPQKLKTQENIPKFKKKSIEMKQLPEEFMKTSDVLNAAERSESFLPV